MNDKITPAEQQLIDALSENRHVQGTLLEQAQITVRMAQAELDKTNLNMQSVRYFEFPKEEIDLQIRTVQRVSDGARALSGSLREGIEFYKLGANSTSVSTGSIAVTIPILAKNYITNPTPGSGSQQHPFKQFVPPPSGDSPYFKVRSSVPPEELTKHVKNILAMVDRGTLVEEVRSGMLRCGLHRSKHGNSALALLDDHDRMIRTPAGTDSEGNGPVMVLRSSVQRAVDDVYNRCQPQEPTGGSWEAKIVSIGKRCGVVVVAQGYFQDLAKRFIPFWKVDLSGRGKGAELSREETLLISHDGLQLLKALLDGVDEKRLRPS